MREFIIWALPRKESQADLELGKGRKVPEVCKSLEITEQTYYRWRQKYGGMQPDMLKEMRSLQKENDFHLRSPSNLNLEEYLRAYSNGGKAGGMCQRH